MPPVRGALELGREAASSASWRDAYAHLSVADAEAPLAPEDLERLATAAYLIGLDHDAHAAWSRAYHEHADRGDTERAARCGFWLSLTSVLAGEEAQGSGWLSRTQRLLDTHHLDCVTQGYLQVIQSYMTLSRGDPVAALAVSRDAHACGVRFADLELTSLGLLGQGEALIESGEAIDGTRLLDEAMIAVTAGEVSPISAGILYCASVLAAQRAFDLRRVHEWTIALDRWSGSQPDLVPFRGQCLAHRAEIKALHGDWHEAFVEVQRACDWLTHPRQPAAGIAFYQLGELLRLRGDLTAAEEAYREANRFGHDPDPGLALLRLAQGRTDAAAAAVRRVLDDAPAEGDRPPRPERTRVLSAAVEIRLAAGDLDGAGEAAAELATAASAMDTLVLHATSGQMSGAVAVAAGATREGLVVLRRARQLWTELNAPYEVARVRVWIGRALRDLGDADGATLELDAASATFERLGAVPDLEWVAGMAQGSQPGPLTDRELEVLRLVAEGRTNREIAATLVISERTVARHIANILAKLDVSSRAAATAFGLTHHLI